MSKFVSMKYLGTLLLFIVVVAIPLITQAAEVIDTVDFGFVSCSIHGFRATKDCGPVWNPPLTPSFPRSDYVGGSIHYVFSGHRHGRSEIAASACLFSSLGAGGRCDWFLCAGSTCGPEDGPGAPFREYMSGDITTSSAPASYSVLRSSYVEDAEIIVAVDGYAVYTVPDSVPGCTDASADNYNPSATVDDGSCTYSHLECISSACTAVAGVGPDKDSCVTAGSVCGGGGGGPPLPTCTLSFSPSAVSKAGDPSTATWSSSNDADGSIPFSCTGNIGGGTLTPGSGFRTVNPTTTPTQTCTLTVVNSSGTSRTCSNSIPVGAIVSACNNNGIREGTEECDNGVANGVCPATCSTSCTTNSCVPPTPPPTPPPEVREIQLTDSLDEVSWTIFRRMGVTPGQKVFFRARQVGLNPATDDCKIEFDDGSKYMGFQVDFDFTDNPIYPPVPHTYLVSCHHPDTDEYIFSNRVEIWLQAPKPIVDIKADGSNGPLDVDWNSRPILSWISSSAISCQIFSSEGWTWSGLDISGSRRVPVPLDSGAYIYTLTCSNENNSNSDTVTVNVGLPPPPTVTISAAPNPIAYAAASTLSWSSTNATSCTASGSSGAWSGARATSGSTSTGSLTSNQTYTLTCTGAGGSASGSVTVTVSPPSPNDPSDVTVTEPNYCVSGPAITVSWTYSDPAGSPQRSYQVQIDNNDSFSSPEIDTGKINSPSGSWFSGLGRLEFDERYRARVRVWNSFDLVSGWQPATACVGPGCDGSSGRWRTPEYPYPQTDFNWTANGILNNPSPPLNKPVSFTDQTVFNGPASGRKWSWLFGDSGTSTTQNPSHTYTTEGSYFVTLTATDSAGQACARTKGPLIIQKPIPKWREIAPK